MYSVKTDGYAVQIFIDYSLVITNALNALSVLLCRVFLNGSCHCHMNLWCFVAKSLKKIIINQILIKIESASRT